MAELPEPFGSPPGRPGKYALYLSRHGDDDTQCMAVVFAAPYAARKFLDVLLGGDGIVWDDKYTIRSETGIVVSTRWWAKRMRECVEHEYSLQEMGWTLDGPHRKWALQFRHGPEQLRTLEEDAGYRERQAKRAARGSSVPRASRDGLVAIGAIAEELGITPRDARGALRSLKLVKPSSGWAWPAAEVEDIKAKIKEVVG